MQINKVSAESGLEWWKTGFRLVFEEPIVILVSLAFFVAYLFALIPFIGPIILVAVYSALLFLGLAAAALQMKNKLDNLDQVVDFVTARSSKIIQYIIIVCVFSIITTAITFGIMFATGIGMFAPDISNILSGQTPDQQTLEDLAKGSGSLAVMGVGTFFLFLFNLVISVIMAAAFSLSPSLILFQDMEPVDAIKTSIQAWMSNFGAFLVFYLLLIPISIAIALTCGLGLLVFFPAMVASLYAAYHKMFENPAPSPSVASL